MYRSAYRTKRRVSFRSMAVSIDAVFGFHGVEEALAAQVFDQAGINVIANIATLYGSAECWQFAQHGFRAFARRGGIARHPRLEIGVGSLHGLRREVLELGGKNGLCALRLRQRDVNRLDIGAQEILHL